MKPTETRELHRRSPNGDRWFLARDPATGAPVVRHRANTQSGGQVTDVEIGAFLSGPRHPEQDTLLRLIGTLIVDAPRTDADDEPSRVRTGMAYLGPLNRGDRASSAPGSS